MIESSLLHRFFYFRVRMGIATETIDNVQLLVLMTGDAQSEPH